MKEKKRVQKNHKGKIIVVTAIVCFLLFFSIVFSLINITNSKILPKIEVMDIDVGNQEKSEAEKNLLDVVEKKVSGDILLRYKDYEATINPSQFETKIDVTEAIAKAYNTGRDGNIVTNNYCILWNYIKPKKLDGQFY